MPNFANKDKIILHLCADTGSDSKPYQDAGYTVILVGKKIGVEKFHPPENVHGIFANPVCTEFSRARSGGIARDPEKGMFLVKECQRIISECKPVFWVIENPASGALRNYLGKPVMTYQPWNFGSPWTKNAALWGKFNKPQKLYHKWEEVPNKLPALYIRPGRTKPGLYQLHARHKHLIPEFNCFQIESRGREADKEFRSLCSQKFACAFYKANP